MPVIDVTEFDFSQEHALGTDNVARRVAVVRNPDSGAVLHVGIKSPVAWLDVYPSEFALAPDSMQTVTAELRPDRARNSVLSPTNLSLFGQYLAIHAADAGALPEDVSVEIAVITPLANCPECGADLAEGARECRRCGARIRLCPVCGTPNTWLAKTCRASAAHLIRSETDWLCAPGGDASHAVSLSPPLGIHLARRWSVPSFPPSDPTNAAEWSAPLTAFGMVFASAIEPKAGRATVQAFELSTGAALWEVDLPDARGIYPDRGAMALSQDGTLYAATLGGHVVAYDAIRGTRRWAMRLDGAVYGGVVVAGETLFVPAGTNLCALNRATGELLHSMPVGGRLDAAPGVAGDLAFAACDDTLVYAFDIATGKEVWRVGTDGAFDAAPLIKNGVVYAATMAGTLYALDSETGQTRWRTSVSAQGITVAPALSLDGLLFVAGDDGFVHIVAAETGHLIRSRRISAAPLRSSPVVSGQTVFLGADDGSLYALDGEYQAHRAYETSPGARVASAGLALYGDTLVCTATNGVLYALRATA